MTLATGPPDLMSQKRKAIAAMKVMACRRLYREGTTGPPWGLVKLLTEAYSTFPASASLLEELLLAVPQETRPLSADEPSERRASRPILGGGESVGTRT